MNKKKIIDIAKIMLILIWMAVVFGFSNENGGKSTSTSRKVTTTVVQAVSNKSEEEKDKLQKVLENGLTSDHVRSLSFGLIQ